MKTYINISYPSKVRFRKKVHCQASDHVWFFLTYSQSVRAKQKKGEKGERKEKKSLPYHPFPPPPCPMPLAYCSLRTAPLLPRAPCPLAPCLLPATYFCLAHLSKPTSCFRLQRTRISSQWGGKKPYKMTHLLGCC